MLRRQSSSGKISVPNRFSIVHIGSGAPTEAIGSSKDRGKGQPTFGKSEQVQVDLNSVVSLETIGSIRFVAPSGEDSLNPVQVAYQKTQLSVSTASCKVLSFEATRNNGD